MFALFVPPNQGKFELISEFKMNIAFSFGLIHNSQSQPFIELGVNQNVIYVNGAMMWAFMASQIYRKLKWKINS